MRKIRILLIEDELDHVDLFKLRMQDLRLANTIVVYQSGVKAMEYLKSRLGQEGEQGELPDIVMLDLGLPGESGLDFLKEIKGHPDFKHIPVIIHSASKETEDVLDSYRLGGTHFLPKTAGIKMLREIINHLKTTGMIKLS